MELIDYLLYVVVWIMGAVWGWYARERHAERTINRFIDRVTEQVQEQKESLVPITVEKHNGVLYIYNKENNEFMGQGLTRKEVEEVLSKRYPDQRFMATPEDLRVLNESV